jgi:transposase
MVLDGADRTSVAETWGMDRQTLRDWVHRYNAEGLPGLYDRKRPGARPKLTAEQRAALAAMIEAGPDPAVHGMVRWRRVDLRDELQRQFGVALHERSVGKVLKRLGYRRLSVRPRLPPPSSSMAPAITSPKTSPFAKTSPSLGCRHAPPNSTRWKTSGIIRALHPSAFHAAISFHDARSTAPPQRQAPCVRAKQLPRSATLIFRSAEPAAKSP